MLRATIKEDPVLLFLLLLLFATSNVTIIIIASGIVLVIIVHISHLLKTAASISELAGIIVVFSSQFLKSTVILDHYNRPPLLVPELFPQG